MYKYSSMLSQQYRNRNEINRSLSQQKHASLSQKSIQPSNIRQKTQINSYSISKIDKMHQNKLHQTNIISDLQKREKIRGMVDNLSRCQNQRLKLNSYHEYKQEKGNTRERDNNVRFDITQLKHQLKQNALPSKLHPTLNNFCHPMNLKSKIHEEFLRSTPNLTENNISLTKLQNLQTKIRNSINPLLRI